ncbi:MAG: indole-3-glycerol phosphate synthase TrpC [Campylobacterales bacterium]
MILQNIVTKTVEEVEKRKQVIPIEKLLTREKPILDLRKSLKSTPENPYPILAEIKKGSPSRGIIRPHFNPVEIGKIYNRWADAISILTEPFFFKGSPDYLRQVAREVEIPILRKDFIVDRYQIAEAYSWGADGVLLIVAALEQPQLKELYTFAKELGLEVLVEVHNREELERALELEPTIVGFNHRDLKTFQMNMELGRELIPLIPKGVVKVAESGINSFQTIQYLHKLGVDAFLIGEHLMRQSDIGRELRRLKGLEE